MSTAKAALHIITKISALINYPLAILTILAGGFLIYALFLPYSKIEERSTIEFSYLQDKESALDVNQALVELKNSNNRAKEISTDRIETPFWLYAKIEGRPSANQAIELPSRHIQKIQYFLLNNDLDIISTGETSRTKPGLSNINRSKAGFSISLPNDNSTYEIIIKIESSGPGRISLHNTSIDALLESEDIFNKSGGVLFGSLLMIAAFSALISAISKDYIFLIFAAWVITSLRIASYSAGWDFSWLEFPELEENDIFTKNIPLAIYTFFTVRLFLDIFKKDIIRINALIYMRALLALSLALIICSTFTPHKTFLPILWSIVVPSSCALIFFTIRIFLRTGSRVAGWYGASWLATLAGGLSEVAYAAGFTSSKPTIISSLGGSVIAALLTGIAIALRLRMERLARLSAQREKFEVLEKFKENYNAMPVGLFSMTRDGDVRLFNPAFATMFGVSAEQQPQPNLNLGALIGESSLARFLDAGNSPGSYELEFRLADPQLGGRWFLARLSPKEETIEGSLQEITVRKEAEAKLRHLVDHDSLTGLLNQHGLEDAMSLALSEVALGNPCAVAHVDLDRFKLINELYGHAVGDAMLTEMAQRLSKTVRTRDFVARIGDSFVVVFMDCPDIAAAGLADRLRESVGDQPFHILGKTLSMTVSIGVVAIEQSMKAVDALAAADRACAEAKHRGRNCVVQFNERDGMLKRHLEELKVVADLRHRIPTERYLLEFQPIVSLRAAGNSLSYEVLIRMRDENGGVVAPGRFIGAAERNGLMSQIDRWVLANTLTWIDEHPEHRSRLTFATLNLSGASLNDARFVEDAFAMIAEHPHAVRKVCFEITESVALHDVDSTQRFVERVRAFGSQVALDDFGAGYTSFNYLKEIPANYIKIDGSFVKDINLNPANYAITRTIVDLTHELGMQSIAEWAETSDTVASLLELGVDYAQGFGLARPMPKELVTGAVSCGALLRDPTLVAMLSSPQSIPGLTAKTKRSG
jgi:diguanylate cyclase (GGDEF)-like protein